VNRSRHFASAIAISTIGCLAAACSASPHSQFESSQGDSSSGATDPNGGGGGGGGTFNNGPGGTSTAGGKCVGISTAAKAVPLNLVFMFDQSGSMGDYSDIDGDHFNRAVRWDPVTAAMKSFFADPATAGISASLTYFPYVQSQQGSPGCGSTHYASPEIGLTPLPNSTSFAQSLSSHNPGGGTPTDGAAQGAMAQARAVAGAHPGQATAIVLVTDGDPQNCDDNDPQTVADDLATVAATIPTYVIGVGPDAHNLDIIAAGGSPDKQRKHIQVDTANGAQANQEFKAALDEIRGAALACDFQMPAAPAGQKLDITTVNVIYTPGGGAPQTLTYNKACTGGTGWHYDNADAPSRIIVCDNSCNSAKASKGGSIEVSIGCATQGGVVK